MDVEELKQQVGDIEKYCIEVEQAIDDSNPEDACGALQLIIDTAQTLIDDIDI